MNINFIIPCYNEEEILYNSIKYLINKLEKNVNLLLLKC